MLSFRSIRGSAMARRRNYLQINLGSLDCAARRPTVDVLKVDSVFTISAKGTCPYRYGLSTLAARALTEFDAGGG